MGDNDSPHAVSITYRKKRLRELYMLACCIFIDPPMSDPTYIAVNEPPFDDEKADVVIRSSDGFEYRTHQVLLRRSSVESVWPAVLSLPQPRKYYRSDNCSILSTPSHDMIPIIPVPEDSKVVDPLLRLCYPPWDDARCRVTLLSDLETCLGVVQAAQKYCMDGPEKIARTHLLTHHLLPLSLGGYAVALHAQRDRGLAISEETRRCARAFLRTPLLEQAYTPELECITAGDYLRLHSFHVRCGNAAEAVARNLRWIIKENSPWFECTACRGLAVVVISSDRRKWASKWWTDFIGEAAVALKERPTRQWGSVQCAGAGYTGRWKPFAKFLQMK
ncbi:unnamed protein product [Mycena citricolor]|uniref:BTB domain-containing protein n=1 Tax=Mycena citricolor TaxID=2018698 RepID=A0AAD2Q755_9AGAR|nr:unnamed protein product [Mycena citricolor]